MTLSQGRWMFATTSGGELFHPGQLSHPGMERVCIFELGLVYISGAKITSRKDRKEEPLLLPFTHLRLTDVEGSLKVKHDCRLYISYCLN